MSTFSDGKFPLACPKCKKDLGLKISDILNRGKARCSSCGSEVIFDSSAIYNVKSAISEFERAMQNVDKAKQGLNSAMSKIMNKAQFNIKT